MLQLDPSQMKKEDGNRYGTPLECLCQNSRCNAQLMTFLLEINSMPKAVGKCIKDYIQSLEYAEDYSGALEKIDILLKASPKAAKYREKEGNDGRGNLLHFAACSDLPSALCIDIMQRISAIHPDAVKEGDEYGGGDLPLHCAVRDCTLEVMEFLLNLYPASATMLCPIPYEHDDDDDEDDEDDDVNNYGDSLLHLAVNMPSPSAAEIVEAKVRFFVFALS